MTSATPKLERVSVVVACLLCAIILLPVVGPEHQMFASRRTILQDFDFVNVFMWLCPAFVLLIFRRSWFVIAAYAVPILVLFVARSYYFWQLEALGTNVVYQSGYWVVFLQHLLSGVSILVLSYWLLWGLMFLTAKYTGGEK